MMNIDTLNIELSNKCNLNCNYCYHKYLNNKPNNDKCIDMSQLDIIKNSDIISINITGGEPTLDSRLYDLSEMFANNKNVTLTTNGIERINSLDSFSTIIVSVDGFLNEMNLNRNIYRYQYELIVENVLYYLDAGKNVQLNMVITKQTLHQFGDFIRNNQFGNRLTYSIIVVSHKTLDKRFTIDDQASLNYIGNEVNEIYKYYNYHIQLKSNLMAKKTFLDTFTEENPITYFVTYSIPNNKYVYVNREFNEFENMYQNYNTISKKYTVKIIQEINRLCPNDLFNPYSLAELAHFNNF